MGPVRMNYSSAIDKRGRVTVPLEVRIRLGLSAGDRVESIRVLRSHLLSGNPCGRFERSSVRKAFPPERDSHSQPNG